MASELNQNDPSLIAIEPTKHAWKWVPTLYFMEGLPGVMIMVVLAIMFKNFGLSNTQITLYTGSLVLPWVIKPVWASFIDIIRTKRWWIYCMEICIAACFVAMAISVKASDFLILCVTFSWVIAFMSSSHDIAADGFYLMKLHPSQQAFFVGVQGAAYNIGKVCATGGIVVSAGIIFDHVANYHIAWFFALLIVAIICLIVGCWHKFMLPKEENKQEKSFKQAIIKFGHVYWDFIRIKRLWLGLLFLFFYRAGESIIYIILPLFLLDPKTAGGMGLNDQFTGMFYGSLAPIAIVLGSLIGGWAIYKKGFKFWIWYMLLLENIPHLLYFVLAHYHIYDHKTIATFIFIEQFCFSFGLCGYQIFLYYMVRCSRFKTAHYAFFSGIMQLAVMIPVMLSGWLQNVLGYQNLFLYILVLIIPTGIIILAIRNKVSDYGKRGNKAF